MTISGKILIKKKSGPGELTGINEIDVSDVGALFKGLQFTEAGDYVLSITSTSNLADPKEITIKVLQEDQIIAQEESKGTDSKKEKNIDGTRPIITQIDKPSIKLPPIKMDQDNSGSTSQKNYTVGLGYTPFIWYKSYQISDRDIKSLTLYHEGIIPKIKFSFYDSMNLMKTAGAPTDDTTVELFLNSTSANLKSIHMSFKIEEFHQGPYTTNQKFEITGTINIPKLYLTNNKSYNDTSFSSFRQICKDMEIGFNSNIDNTDDKMPWRNSNKKPYQFIEDVISHSYISDESFMVGYIDYYYCFNYVDVEKEMNRDISNDVGIDTSGTSENSTPDETDRISKLKLSNDKSFNNSSFYFDSFTTRNDSTKKSLKKGYTTKTKSYDRLTKSFLVFDVDSTTSDGNKTIILKGQENDPNYFKDNYTTKFTGKIDTDNVHKNYNYSITQNRINLDNLNKVCVNVKLPNPNFNLYKFQKINIEIINETQTPTDTSLINYRYSGDYIIADISFTWNSGKLMQELRLIRKELGKTPEEIKNNPPVEKKKETKEINNNPVQNSDVTGFTGSVADQPQIIDPSTGLTASDDGSFIYDDYGDDELSDEYNESGFAGEEETDVVIPPDAQLDLMNKQDLNREDLGYSSSGESISGRLAISTDTSSPGFGIIGKSMTDQQLLKIMVSYIEGGYYYPAHASNWNATSRNLYKSSGETLWGIDRFAGNTEGLANGGKGNSNGISFWSAVDKLSGYGSNASYSRVTKTSQWDYTKYPIKTGSWTYGFMPTNKKVDPALYTQMFNAFTNYASVHLTDWLDDYFGSHALKNIILGDSRLKFMWLRATWNGVGWFGWYVKGNSKMGVPYGIKYAYDTLNIQDADSLIIWDLNNRLKFNSTLITHDVKKIANLIGIKNEVA